MTADRDGLPGRAEAGLATPRRRGSSCTSSMGAFALLLRWLTWPGRRSALAAGALLFNLFVLPHVAQGLYRPGDRGAQRARHRLLPARGAALLLLFPPRLDIVAAAWGILAVGDGVATLAGRAIGGPRWPWNHDKTVAGSSRVRRRRRRGGRRCSRGGAALPVRPPMLFATMAVPLVAAITAALVETIPISSTTTCRSRSRPAARASRGSASRVT